MGCGRVGVTLVRRLEALDHTVTVVDSDANALERLPPDVRAERVRGVGFDRDVLIRAGIESADAFAAVAAGDNSNILAARVVRETFGVRNVVARIYDPGRADVYERLGIPTVASVRWTADRVLRRLLPEGTEPVWSDPSGRARLAQIRVDSGWAGHRLAEIEQRTGGRVAFVLRLGEGSVPAENALYQDGDLLYLAIEEARVGAAELLLAAPPRR